MESAAPKTLGRYELVSLLGRGGHGEVWRARKAGPMGFSAEVAIKVLNATGSGEQLQREARVGALLRHPNVVAVHGLEEIDGRWVMEMELVEGCSLREVVKRHRQLSPRALVQLGFQVLEGLAHIHGLEVDGKPVRLVHRDIKPGNLLLDPAGTVRIADLGVACLAAEQAAAGTVGYASPEQLRGDAIDGRSDLFSLAAVLVRACGRRSLVGRGDVGMVRTLALDAKRVRTWVEPVDALLPGLAPLMARWLDPDPDNRPADAWEALDQWAALDVRNAKGPSLAEMVRDEPIDGPMSNLGESPEPAVRRQLPPPMSSEPLVGRDALLGAAQAAWAQGPVLLVGPGGIGKTHLARAMVARRGGATTGVWVDTSRCRGPSHLRAALARAFGVEASSSAEGLAAAALTACRGERRWVVFDTLEQLQPDAEAWLDAWIDAVTPVFSVLGTSRRARPGPGWAVLPVEPLAPEASVALFRLRCPMAAPSDAEAIETVVRALEGIPLAIELAARARLGVEPLATAPERHRSLDACLEASWALLDPAARAALTGLSVFEGVLDRHGAQAVVRPEGPVSELMQQLGDASLLYARDGRMHMLDVVRRFVRRRAPAEARAMAEQRHADWYVQLARDPKPEHLRDLVAATRRARAAGRPSVAARCALGAWKTLEERGPAELGVELLEPLLDVVVGRDRVEVVLALSGALAACGRLEDALQRLDDELSDAVDPKERALYLERRGTRLFELGRLGEAKTCLEQAVALHRQRANQTGEANSLGLLGVVLHRSGHAKEAIGCYEEAIRLHTAHGNAARRGASLTNLGSLKLEMGEGEEARRLLEEAVRLYRREKNPRLEAVALISLSMMVGRAGQLELARKLLLRSIRLAQRVGAARTLAFAEMNLGLLQHGVGESAAGATFERALSAVARCRDPRAEGHIHRAWGHWAFEAGDRTAGRHHLDVALRIAERHQVDGLAPLVRALLAWLELLEGAPDRARALLETADTELVGSARRDVELHVDLVWCAWDWDQGRTSDGDARLAEAMDDMWAMGCREGSLLHGIADRLRARFRSGAPASA